MTRASVSVARCTPRVFLRGRRSMTSPRSTARARIARRVLAHGNRARGNRVDAVIDPDDVDGVPYEAPSKQPSDDLRGTGVVLPPITWASDAWRWGSAIGDAHDAAAVVRAALNASEDARKRWLVSMISTSPLPEQNYVPWEECKLVLALCWQLSGHRGAHACANGAGSWLDVMENLRRGYYEEDNSVGGDVALARDMGERLSEAGRGLIVDARRAASEATNGDEVWTHDAVRRATAAAVLLELEFLEVGI